MVFTNTPTGYTRTTLSIYKEGKRIIAVPKNAPAAGPALKKDFPEVKDFVRIFPSTGRLPPARQCGVQRKRHLLCRRFGAPGISFPLLKGNAATALTEPGTVVLTASAAKRYFGAEDPLGKTLELREGTLQTYAHRAGGDGRHSGNTHLAFEF
jgi:putative ABC transport system permease protein